jgi:hypothetical protein
MKILLPFVFLLIAFVVCGQDVLLESTPPPSIRWNQINTPGFRVIFPKGFDEQGQRVAQTLENIRLAEAKSLGSVPRKISIILQNQSSISNGFVSILPRRSEFYAMPSQDYNFQSTNDWLDLLASHEYRHIVQYQHAIRGFNKAFYYLFGAATLAGFSQAAAPSWFWEGDAVATETAFTRAGRGKIPNFALLFRTNFLEGRTFNYHKQYLRSYKHNIPDHYVLGYHMVSYLRRRTNDPEIWGKITARSWSVPFIPFAFSNAIKKETGLYVTQLYREMAKDLQNQWQQTIDSIQLTSFQTIPVSRRNAYTDYLYPHMADDGSVIVMKKGIGNIEEFVALNNGSEKHVFTPGYINDSGMISVNGPIIVWNEYGFDPRWNIRTYSLIKAYDIVTKKRYVIGDKTSRYTSAAISPDQRRVVAIETDEQYKTSIHILSFPEGQVLKKLSNENNYFYAMPRWSSDGKAFVVLKVMKEGKTMVIIDADTNIESEVVSPVNENFGYPVLYNNYLLFNSPVTGIDNIYAIDLNTRERFTVTSSKYGAYNPSISSDGSRIFYNEQTRNGLDVVYTDFKPEAWKRYVPVDEKNLIYEHLVHQENSGDLFQTNPTAQYPVKKYPKHKGIINPYAWGLYVNNSLTEANVGITSQDVLSTTKIDLGYRYDINERTSSWRADVSYQGLYLIIDVSAALSNRSVNEGNYEFTDTLANPDRTYERQVAFEWKEKNLQAGLRLPLTTTSSRYASGVTISNYVGITNVTDFTNSVTDGGRIVREYPGYFFRTYQDNGTLVYNNANLTAYRLMKRSRRDINSRWGQRLSLEHYATPYGGDFRGDLLAVTGTLYAPGVFRHHSLWGYWAYQQTLVEREADNYLFRNQIPVPRGLSVGRYQQFYSMSANYTLPIWYPDIALGPIVNIQRLRANAFLDYGFGRSELFSASRTFTSVGIEGRLDINIFRFLPQFDIGARYSVGLSPEGNRFEVLIGTFNL